MYVNLLIYIVQSNCICIINTKHTSFHLNKHLISQIRSSNFLITAYARSLSNSRSILNSNFNTNEPNSNKTELKLYSN